LKNFRTFPLAVGLVAALRCAAFAADSDAAAALNKSGTEKLAKGDLQGAAVDFSAAIKARPSFVYAYISRGVIRNRVGQFNRAIRDFDVTIQLQPSVTAYMDRAQARLDKGDADGAVVDYIKSLDYTTDFPRSELAAGVGKIFESRATAKQVKGDFDGAADDYSRAIEEYAGKNDESARILQAVVLRRLNRGNPMLGLEKSLDAWKDEWPKAVASFLTGTLPQDAFLAKAGAGDAAAAPGRRCAAQYYIGMNRLSRTETAGARAAFKAAVDTKARSVPEYDLARAEFKRLPAPKKPAPAKKSAPAKKRARS